MNPSRTVGDLIRWGASRFDEAKLVFGHGTDSALDESAALVMHALHLDTGLTEDCLHAVPTEAEDAEIVRLIESRIATRKPAAYLTHEAWFAGLPFYVDERVLVPRSPLAELIVERFAPWIVPERVGPAPGHFRMRASSPRISPAMPSRSPGKILTATDWASVCSCSTAISSSVSVSVVLS
jgi:hypothetical protein